MRDVDTLARLLLRHLIKNRVVERTGGQMLPPSTAIVQFALQSEHSDLQILLSLC